VDDGAVDACGCGSAVALVSGLAAGLFLPAFGCRFGVGWEGAGRRVRPAGGRVGDGGGQLQEEELNDERIAVCEFGGLGFGEMAAAKRGKKGRVESGRRCWRSGNHDGGSVNESRPLAQGELQEAEGLRQLKQAKGLRAILKKWLMPSNTLLKSNVKNSSVADNKNG
jgi:hypothetical protein